MCLLRLSLNHVNDLPLDKKKIPLNVSSKSPFLCKFSVHSLVTMALGALYKKIIYIQHCKKPSFT